MKVMDNNKHWLYSLRPVGSHISHCLCFSLLPREDNGGSHVGSFRAARTTPANGVKHNNSVKAATV